jgi:hypothetical protein
MPEQGSIKNEVATSDATNISNEYTNMDNAYSDIDDESEPEATSEEHSADESFISKSFNRFLPNRFHK